MKNVDGFWLPDGDTFFVDKPDYEIKDTNIALHNVDMFRTAVDVGAHCGYWTQRLAKKFKNVISLEPVNEHFECLIKNTDGLSNITLINAAASNGPTSLNMQIATQNSGQSNISNGGISVNAITLDSLKIKNVDFIKIDVEGHEDKVLVGALKTIRSYKPTLLIEINDNYKNILNILKPMKFEIVAKRKNNYVWKCMAKK